MDFSSRIAIKARYEVPDPSFRLLFNRLRRFDRLESPHNLQPTHEHSNPENIRLSHGQSQDARDVQPDPSLSLQKHLIHPQHQASTKDICIKQP